MPLQPRSQNALGGEIQNSRHALGGRRGAISIALRAQSLARGTARRRNSPQEAGRNGRQDDVL